MASFGYNFHSPSVLCILMLIGATAKDFAVELQNINFDRKTKWIQEVTWYKRSLGHHENELFTREFMT